jgi:hypothetical protein
MKNLHEISRSPDLLGENKTAKTRRPGDFMEKPAQRVLHRLQTIYSLSNISYTRFSALKSGPACVIYSLQPSIRKFALYIFEREKDYV